MKSIFSFLLFSLAFLANVPAFAVCSSPAGDAGDVIYESTGNVVQYCNGTNWVNTGAKNASAGTGGCSSPAGTEGDVVFISTTGTLQFCNGEAWVNMSCSDAVNTGGGGCTSPAGTAGDMIYTTGNKLQFCDSTNWVNAGGICLGGGVPFVPFMIAIGGANNDRFDDIALDADGNIYASGGTLSDGAGSWDNFIVKFDNTGSHVWSKTIGGVSVDYSYMSALALDSSGNLYTAGPTQSDGAGGEDIVVNKLDSDGNLIWSKTIGGSSHERIYDMAIDGSDNVFLAGATYSDGVWGLDGFVVKLDTSGNHVWSKTIGGAENVEFNGGVALDGSGNIYLSGWTAADGAGDWDGFVVKLNSSGSIIWDKTIGGSGREKLLGSVAVDNSNNVYVSGYTESDGAGSDDGFIVKLDTNGSIIWDKTIGGSDNDSLDGKIALDSSGNIYFAGKTRSDGKGSYDGFVAKLDTNGNHVWSKTIGGTSSDYLNGGLVLDGSGNIYLSGYTSAGSGYSIAGGQDGFIVTLDPDGNGCTPITNMLIANATDADTIANADNADTIANASDSDTIANATDADTIADADDADTVTNLCGS